MRVGHLELNAELGVVLCTSCVSFVKLTCSVYCILHLNYIVSLRVSDTSSTMPEKVLSGIHHSNHEQYMGLM